MRRRGAGRVRARSALSTPPSRRHERAAARRPASACANGGRKRGERPQHPAAIDPRVGLGLCDARRARVRGAYQCGQVLLAAGGRGGQQPHTLAHHAAGQQLARGAAFGGCCDATHRLLCVQVGTGAGAVSAGEVTGGDPLAVIRADAPAGLRLPASVGRAGCARAAGAHHATHSHDRNVGAAVGLRRREQGRWHASKRGRADVWFVRGRARPSSLQ